MPSTSIRKSRYDPEPRFSPYVGGERQTLCYDAVPQVDYAAFRNAFAKGRYFNEHIRDRFATG